MAIPEPLSAALLYRVCDPSHLPFASTAELAPDTPAIGQERALEALRFGVAMARDDYNIFTLGPAGLGKHTLARSVLEEGDLTLEETLALLLESAPCPLILVR